MMFLTVDLIEFQADKVTSSEKSTAVDNSKELESPVQVDPQECVAGDSKDAAREAVSEAKPDVAPETSVATPVAQGKSLVYAFFACIHLSRFLEFYVLVEFVDN